MTPSPSYDLFISYAEADRAWVEGYLLDALQHAGMRYQSEATFTLGVPRILEFERAVRESTRTLLILSPAYLVDGFSQFADLLAQNYGVEAARWPVIPMILNRSTVVPPRLAMLTSLDASDPEHWQPAIERLCAELQRPVPGPPPQPDCPYPGMVPFRAQDTQHFFGRDTEIRQMIMHLRHQRFLLVVGPSGSGKSSLIRAGLLPNLVQSNLFPARSWLVRLLRPGSHPLAALAQALEGDLREPKHRLGQVLAAHPPAQRLLLIVDQFEELFTQATPARQTRFISALNTLRTFESCTVIVIMRADFYPDLMNSDLWPVQGAQRFDIAILRGQALRQAIERPATNAGIYFEAGLIERLVADAANEPGALPLLQETMVLLWGQMQRHLLTAAAYDRLGSDGRSGLAVAMATKADATLASLSPAQRTIARRIFLRLIQFGEGRADTRRQQNSDALRAAGDDPLLFDQTLRHLVDNRLLTLSGEAANGERRVDIAHEALISGWATLGEWILERREAEQVRRRLEAKATEWARLGRGSGGLLDEAELPEAQRWLSSPDATDLGYEATLGALVEASTNALHEQVAQKSRIARFRRLAFTTIAILLIGALGLGLLIAQREALNQRAIAAQQQSARATAETYAAQQQALRAEAETQRNHAREQADIATSHGLAAQAISLLDSQLDLAMLLSIEAYNTRDTPEARKALLTALEHLPVTRFLQNGYVRDLAFSPNGKVLAVASDRSIVLWDVASGMQKGKTLTSTGGEDVLDLAFSPDGATLASVGDYGAPVLLWDVASGELRKTQPAIATGRYPSVTFSYDGSILAVGLGFDHGIALWDVTAEKPGPRLDAGGQVNDVAFSPDGKILAASVGGESGAVQLWDITTQQQVASLPMPEGAWTIAFSPDGASLAACTRNSSGKTVLWSMATRQQVGAALDGSVSDQPFSPDSTKLILRGPNDVVLWDIAAQQSSHSFTLNNLIGRIIAFSPDGQTFASGYGKDPVALWDITLGQRLAHRMTSIGPRRGKEGGLDPIASVAYILDGGILAAGGANYDAVLWDVARQTRLIDPIVSPADGTGSIALSADGKLLATGGNDGTVMLWDTANGKQHGDPFTDMSDRVHSLAFSPDGALIAATGINKTFIWDVATHKLHGKIPSGRLCIAFSPDSRLLAVDEHSESRFGIALWDPATMTRVGTLVHPETPEASYFTSVAFSPDGTTIAAVVGYGLAGGVQTSGFSTVLWDVATKQARGTPLVSASPLYSIAFSPNGMTLAVGGGDGAIQLWDVTTLQPLAPPLAGADSRITGLTFNRNGSALAGMDLKGEVLLWDMSPGRWQQIACQIANHNLSQAEWARYLPQTPYRATCPGLPSP